MPRHLGRWSRCVRCRLPVYLCLCRHITPIPTETRVVVVLHPAENNKPSNSGHLCRELLLNAEVRVTTSAGVVNPPMSADTERRTALLFPDEDAPELTPLTDKPWTLVIPDAPWRQARRMAFKWRSLRSLPRVRLPMGARGRFLLRKAPGGGQALGTLEAVGRALGIVECQWVEDHIGALHDRMVLRGMYARGQMPADKELRRELAQWWQRSGR